MTLVPVDVPDGALVIDTNTKLTAYRIEQLRRAAGAFNLTIFGFIRYVSLGEPDLAHDISPDEAELIVGGNEFALGLVQHAFAEGWMAMSHIGESCGKNAAAHASLVGYPQESHLFADQEGCGSVGAPVSQYCESWAKNWASPGLYIGYQPGLTPDELWELPSFHIYWGAAGEWTVSECGVAMRQHVQENFGGTFIDRNTPKADALGRRIVLAKAA